MNCRNITIFGAALLTAGLAGAPSDALAQTKFQNYSCADGTQFIAGFFQYDPRALSGSRYSGKGVTLRITKAGVTTLKHAKRPVTTCEQT